MEVNQGREEGITNWACVYHFSVQAAHNLNKPVKQYLGISANTTAKENKKQMYLFIFKC